MSTRTRSARRPLGRGAAGRPRRSENPRLAVSASWQRALIGWLLIAALLSGASAAAAQAPDPDDADDPADTADPADPGETPEIVFPVVGPVTYTDTWGACRGAGCSRSHMGVDIFGHKLAPLVAAEDGVITFIRQSGLTISGNAVVVTTDDGWRYLYIHVNNDAPGTDDGSNPQAWIVPNRLRVGDRVEAGQVIAYLGDSGNAETTPAHVHFEIHHPELGAINPTPTVQAADDAGRRVSVASLASSAEGRAAVAPTIAAWYRALLDRDPTDEELFAWADRMDVGFATTDDLIADLTMAKPRRDPAGDVVRAFRVGLDRLPSLTELRAWEGAMRDGTTLEQLGQTLVTSDAFVESHGDLDDADFVAVVYDNALGRPPSEQRLADWLEALAEGDSRGSVAAHLADAFAVKDATWHGLEVIQSFRAALDRMPDADEYARWVGHLDAGGLIPDVVEAIRAEPAEADEGSDGADEVDDTGEASPSDETGDGETGDGETADAAAEAGG